MQNAAGGLLIDSLTTRPRVEFPRVADGALFEKDVSKAQVHDMAALAWTIGWRERALHLDVTSRWPSRARSQSQPCR